MTDRLSLNIEIESDDGEERKSKFVYDLPEGGTADRAIQWFSYYLSTDAQVETIRNEFLSKLPDPSTLCFSNSIRVTTRLGSDMSSYYDATNRGWAWLEICNLLWGARICLARARGYKKVEPAHTGRPGKENEVLYTLHLRKMDEFHLAVNNIKKLEDMILRLIFEALGAALEGIDTSKDEWERKLTLERIKDCLKQRDANEKLKNMPDDEYEELKNILRAMSHGSNQNLSKFWLYRHALEHRVPQSVDYVESYAAFESRPKPLVKDGKVIGMQGFIGAQPVNPDWKFEDLYDITVTVYKHYLTLIVRLSKLPIFKRPA